MIKHRTVEWENDRMKVTLVVTEASVDVGIKRSQLIDAVENRPDWKSAMSIQARVIRHLTYSACAAALESVKIEPKEDPETKKPFELDATDKFDEGITLEQFLGLPEMLVVTWEQAVIDLNPHWVPRAPKKDDPNLVKSGEKEITPSTSGSSAISTSESIPSTT